MKREVDTKKKEIEVAGTRISHPERVIYPDLGLTKLRLARYVESVGDRILTHVANRPLNLLRCPGGSGEPCFFQRHAHDGFPSTVKTCDLGAGEAGVYVDSIAGLVALAQMGVLEIHPWGSRIDTLDRPDRIVFDLDPDAAVPWKRVVETALLLRSMLRELELESFVKTTGGKGLHVVVPVARRHTWDQIKEFSRGIAESLARAAPDLYVATASKAKRRGKVYVDYLRNARGASSVAPYSTRARAGATVSTPIAWKEIDRVTNEQFDVETVVTRLRQAKQDPWKGIGSSRQSISDTAMKSVTVR